MSIVHQCPPFGSPTTHCCGRSPLELPRTDRITSTPSLVTCPGTADARPDSAVAKRAQATLRWSEDRRQALEAQSSSAPAHSLTGSLIARYKVGPRLKRLRLDRAAAIYASSSQPPTEVWLSTSYLVQVFAEPDGLERLSINRTSVLPSGRWADGITWDALQRLKAECGRADRWAVELYPPDGAVVDVANIRHLWLLPAPPAFGWNRDQEAG